MPVRGAKPKPIELKILEGNPGKRKLPNLVPIPSSDITCPTFLSYSARREWKRIIPLLKVLGLLTGLDRAALALYCQWYGRWVDAEKTLKEKGPLYKTSDGKIIQSPMLVIARHASEITKSCLGEFGLTPSARARMLNLSKSDDQDPMEQLLENREN